MGSTDKDMPNYMKFITGGSAGMTATLFVQPLDLLKNRMQLAKDKGVSFIEVVKGVLKNEGLLGFYNGLSAGLLRQATYTTARLGVYQNLFSFFTVEGEPPSFIKKAMIAMTAGVCGAFVGTPAEVALIRMTADGRLPPSERRNYSNVFDALIRMSREEGVATLWRGAIPTMGRAMVVNAAQLATYSQSKEMLRKAFNFKEGIFLYFSASMVSGLVTTCASMPVDIAKTRIQNMKTTPDGKGEYSGSFDVIFKIMKNEGVLALWKGFLPYYARLGPHTVLLLIFLEKFNSAYVKYVMKK